MPGIVAYCFASTDTLTGVAIKNDLSTTSAIRTATAKAIPSVKQMNAIFFGVEISAPFLTTDNDLIP